MRRMSGFLLTLFIIYAALVGLLYIFQRQMIYLPDKNIGAPQEYGLAGFADLRVKAPDGHAIQVWYRKADAGFPTVIYCHGNAAHIGNRAGILGALAEKGFGVLGLSYRGYGKSEGHPSERGLYDDARGAIEFLSKTQNVPLAQILLYGESLGTGVAVQMASEHQVGGLILQAPYTSVAGRAAELYYYVPVKWLIKDRFDSLSKIARIKSPLMIFHGERDQVIPVTHGRKLFEAAAGLKRSFFLPEVAHNDFDSNLISSHVLDFAREHHLIAR